MQNWKDPETLTIYLANGEQARAHVNGISPTDGSGYVLAHGREVKVKPLPGHFRWLGYGEVVSIVLSDGRLFSTVLQPQEYEHHLAWIHISEIELAQVRARNPGDIICTSDNITMVTAVYDQETGRWREMTDKEYEKARRAWSSDMADIAQIKQEWRQYRLAGEETPPSKPIL